MSQGNPPPAATIPMGAGHIRVLLPGDAGAAHSIVEMQVPPGFRGPPIPHHHTRESCTWVVLEGTLGLTLRGANMRVCAGEVAHCEPYDDFVWQNASDVEPLTMLCIYSPGGFEQMLVKTAMALAERGLKEAPPAVLRELMPPLWREFGIGLAKAPDSV